MDRGDDRGKVLAGRVPYIVAFLFCVPVGGLLVSVATGAVEIVLGVVGYLLGAAVLRTATFVGRLVEQGVVPGPCDAPTTRYWTVSRGSCGSLGGGNHP